MIVQVDMGSAQQVKCPKYLSFNHQTKNRTNAPDKKSTLLYLIILTFEKIMLK